jgi:hypothetical protein
MLDDIVEAFDHLGSGKEERMFATDEDRMDTDEDKTADRIGRFGFICVHPVFICGESEFVFYRSMLNYWNHADRRCNQTPPGIGPEGDRDAGR